VTSKRGIVRAQDTVRAFVATMPGGGGGRAARAEAPSDAIRATARQARTPRIRAEDDAASRSDVLTVKQGSSAATTESVLILHGAFNYPGYWWDHTHLTAAVQDHPNADPALVDAVHQAIATWARSSAASSAG
jgi:hypothetical protein